MSVRSITQKTAKDTKQGRKTWQKKGKRHERRGKRLHFVGITKNRDVLNDSDTHTKNTWSCFWKSGSPERASCEEYGILLPGSLSACTLSLAWLSGYVRPRWHSQHTVAWHYRRCLFPSDCMCQELAKSCVLVLLTFRPPNSMRHSERWKVRSECVVSVTVQHTSVRNWCHWAKK